MSEKRSYRCVPSLQQFYSGGALVVSSDGSFLACACGEKINIVNAADGSVRATLEGDSEAVTALALSPNDRLLFSAGHSRLIRVWDLSSNTCLRSWKGHEGPILVIACHNSGGLIATAGSDRKVLVWDVDGGFCTHFFKGHQGLITSIMFHPDPNNLILFSGSEDATVRVWNLQTKKCISVLEKHLSAVTSLDASEDGHILLSAGRDKVVNVWCLDDFGFRLTIPAYEILECVCIVPSGASLASCIPRKTSGSDSHATYFLTVGERGIVRLWSDGGTCIHEQQTSDTTFLYGENETRRGFTTAAMLPSDRGLLCVTADQQFLFYHPTLSADGAFKFNLLRRLVGYNEEIVDLKFLGEEEKYLAVATNLEQVRIYELSTMSCSGVLVGHKEIILCLDTCVSKDGKILLLSGSKDNHVRLWYTESHRCIAVGSGHTGAVSAVAFSKKGKNFFVSGSSDRTIKIWNFDGLEVVDQEVKLKAKAIVIAHDKDINCLAVSPNDGLVCCGSQDRTASIWRLPDLISVTTLKGHKRGIWSVEFSPVDQCVMTSSGDKTVKIWAVSDGSCLKTFEGHTSSVLRASFLSRGTQIASCGADGLVKLWSVRASECIATYDKHEDKVWALAVGKKSEMLATGGGDAIVNLWYDSTDAEKEEAFKKKEEEVLRGQELENAISTANYVKAVQIAFELHRPHKLYELFELLCRRKSTEDPTEKTLRSLKKEDIQQLLEYVREWNTKPKLCHVAHFVLFQIFRIVPPTEIVEVKGVSELLEGLIPYSRRHFIRLDRLVRGTFLLDHTLARLSVLEPDVDMIAPEESVRTKGEVVQACLESTTPEHPHHEQETPSMGKKSKKRKRKSRKSGKEEKEGSDEIVLHVPVPEEPICTKGEVEQTCHEFTTPEDPHQEQVIPNMGQKSGKRKRRSRKSTKKDNSPKVSDGIVLPVPVPEEAIGIKGEVEQTHESTTPEEPHQEQVVPNMGQKSGKRKRRSRKSRKKDNSPNGSDGIVLPVPVPVPEEPIRIEGEVVLTCHESTTPEDPHQEQVIPNMGQKSGKRKRRSRKSRKKDNSPKGSDGIVLPVPLPVPKEPIRIEGEVVQTCHKSTTPEDPHQEQVIPKLEHKSEKEEEVQKIQKEGSDGIVLPV